MKYYIIAGEASGDLHASNLMKGLRQLDSRAEFRFFGGDRMAAVGGNPVRHYRDLAYMGFLPVLLHARKILSNMAFCQHDVQQWQPDVLILVDYAGFNLKMAAFARKHCPGLPVFYYISPKIWAWKQWRIRNFKRDVDRMFIVFPFERQFFARHHYPVTYVGNPSADSVGTYLTHRPDREAWCRQHGLDPQKPILAVLAGSRRQEIKRNLPHMLAAADRYPQVQVVVSGAPGLEPSFYEPFLKGRACPIVFGETYALLSVAYAALVVSGTATLETALFDVPQVVCYNLFGGPLGTKLVRRFLIKTPFISLVNLVAGREVVKELIAYRCRPDQIAAELGPLLNDSPERRAMMQGYADMHRELGGVGAGRRAAAEMLSALRTFRKPTARFEVAGLGFTLDTAGIQLPERFWQPYEPFAVPDVTAIEVPADAAADSAADLFRLKLSDDFALPEGTPVLVSTEGGDEARLDLLQTADGWRVDMAVTCHSAVCAHLCLSADFSEGTLVLAHPEASDPAVQTDTPEVGSESPAAQTQPTWRSPEAVFAVNNALMLMYAFRSAGHGTLEMHASVVENDGKGYLFLGQSGTGKSTHSQLWLDNIPGTRLLNDDNPIVRVHADGSAWVYGSPWSGKTHCYHNRQVPVGAFVALRQAPENKMHPLEIAEAYAELYASSSGLKCDQTMGSDLHETMATVAVSVPFYRLDCLPDAAAAWLNFHTVTENN